MRKSFWLFSILVLTEALLVRSHAAPAESVWWKHAVIDEIYPRSFGDSDGDGVGDLNGISQHLDYLQALGIDAIWIAPMYPSPQVDFGYDVSNYEGIDPQYGTLSDFDRLLAVAKKRHIRIVLDLVLNHSSDQHPWFVESASSRDNAKSDWYVWNSGIAAGSPRAGAYQKKNEHDGKVPPNNWVSLFGGPAWEWSTTRKQFYYHKFYKQQPDLNWRNPAVETAMFDVMRFWLERGVAGFRLDAVPSLFEDVGLRNEPERGGVNARGDPNLKELYTSNLPEVHGVLRRMRAMVDQYPGNPVLIGETYLPSTADIDKWYGGARQDELHLPMDMLVGFGGGARLDAGYFRKYIDEVENDVHGSQPLLVFDNHDQNRSINRFGDGVHDVARAKLIAALLLTTRATALTYYGAPLGMTTSAPTRKEEVRDPFGRDGVRTPMQWTPGPQAGFSTNPKTWLPVASNYRMVNVETESADPNSLLNWYKKLISLRRTNAALRDGKMVMLNKDDPAILSYVRIAAKTKSATVVALNMSAMTQKVTIDIGIAGVRRAAVHTLATSDPALLNQNVLESIVLPPFAAWVAAIEGAP